METTEIQVSPNPATLLDTAIKNKYDIDKLEKLMELYNHWQKDQARKAFNLAMAEFQKRKPEIIKNKSGYDGRYQYATLNSIQKQIDPILSECGLSYRWEQEIGESKIKVSCIAIHSDGHSEKTTLEAPFDKTGSKNDIQAMGSSNSYLFRYTLCAMFGISSEEDNDGKGSQDKKKDPGVTASKNEKKQNVKEQSIEDLHKEYMKIFNQYQEKFGEEKAVPFHPDNWKTERGVREYNYAIKSLKGLLNGNN